MARYVNDYVDHFDVRRMIRFNTRVDRVVQDADRNGWTVETVDASDSRATLHVRAVAVATGHHAKPVVASFPGEKVREEHTRSFARPQGARTDRSLARLANPLVRSAPDVHRRDVPQHRVQGLPHQPPRGQARPRCRHR